MLMAHQVTQMRREIDEIPSAVDRLLTHGAANMKQTATGLRDCNPAFLTSVARGSSDHAATYLKYASELSLGLPSPPGRLPLSFLFLKAGKGLFPMNNAKCPRPLARTETW